MSSLGATAIQSPKSAAERRRSEARAGLSKPLLRSALIIASLVFAVTAQAHEAGPENPQALLSWWSFEPGVVIPLLLIGWLYLRGLRRLAHASLTSIRKSDVFFFAAGWLTLVLALVSPIHSLGGFLFSVHMTQHELLMLVAAPLLVLGRPLVPFLWALPRAAARSLGRWSRLAWWRKSWAFVTNPFVAWLLQAVILWGWHAPALFQATLTNDWMHALQHASFLFSALLFWWALIHGRRRALGFGMAVVYMFTTALYSGLLGALLTFASTVWYPTYIGRTAAWGLTPLEDQQIGGLIMWVPAGLVYIAAGLALFAGWLRESEKRAGASAMSVVETRA